MRIDNIPIRMGLNIKILCHVYTKGNKDLPTLESGTLTHACNLNLKKLNQEVYYEFQASLLSST